MNKIYLILMLIFLSASLPAAEGEKASDGSCEFAETINGGNRQAGKEASVDVDDKKEEQGKK